jgi:putative tryptophan/tyrosine transport system substrate-binding protein
MPCRELWGADVRRRDFITILGGATAAWPLAARAQPAVVGLLSFGSPDILKPRMQAFRQGLKDYGYAEGSNLAVETRWMGEHYDQMPAAASDLVSRHVAVIVTAGTPACLAAKAATKNIPIVFNTGGDPIQLGLVTSMNRPTENITGVFNPLTGLVTKKFDLLHVMLPKATIVGLLLNPRNPQTEGQLREVSPALQALGMQLIVAKASTASEIDTAFADLGRQRADGLVLGSDGFFSARRDQIIELVARFMMPTLYNLREYVEAGGLASYGTNTIDAWHQTGIYTGRILKGEKVADLPVIQTTRFEFVLNLKTASTLGIKISDNVLSLADEVIE